ncbi:uncharacterized protein SAPINGB_P005793 [Magnusiomyces paraingens]|uniref:Rhodanese domain-containing protein n=1 Tax=Magnusiomyces paraingens TaxID=2606893 RepID=A0A5E8C1M6_9ASCO|nr:uncharacterized protein SAPINGB_P005793 [Saprochaete ingens]VVT57634.1 unnamed protein product [Saprochaete ingens]
MIRAPRYTTATIKPFATAATRVALLPQTSIATRQQQKYHQQQHPQISSASYLTLATSRSSTPTLTRSSLFSLTKRAYSAVTIDEPAPVIDFAAVKALATTDPFPSDKYVIVDVREPSEFAAGHIPHALNLPYKSAPGALGLEPEEFQDTFGFAKPETGKELVFYCLGGVRSTAAEALAATFGYKNRANYVGSYDDWIKNQGPLETPQPPAADASAAPEPKA